MSKMEKSLYGSKLRLKIIKLFNFCHGSYLAVEAEILLVFLKSILYCRNHSFPGYCNYCNFLGTWSNSQWSGLAVLRKEKLWVACALVQLQ